MLLKRHFERLLLSPSDLKPLRDDFQVVGVFNPGAILVDGEVILLVRVAERPARSARGLSRRCRAGRPASAWRSTGSLTTRSKCVDPRVVKRKADGLVRLTFISHLRVVRCGDGRSVSEITDVRFLPESELEEFGVEDPRITAIDGRYYFTYVSVSRHGAGNRAGLDDRLQDASMRHGMIFCPENKDVVLFPERIDGEYVALHRPNAATPFCRPEMWIARSPDLIHWGRHECLHGGGAAWETGRVGAGTPPVRVVRRLARDLPRQPPADPAGRGGHVFDRRVAARSREPGEDSAGGRQLRSSSRPPISSGTGFVPDVVFPDRDRRDAGIRISFTTVRPIAARRWLSFRETKSWDAAMTCADRCVRRIQTPRPSARGRCAAASSSGFWLPIKSFDAVGQLEPDAAVAAGDERSLAVAAGSDAPEAVVGDRPVGDDFDATESCRSARPADRWDPAEPDAKIGRRDLGGHVQQEDDHDHQERQPDRRAPARTRATRRARGAAPGP